MNPMKRIPFLLGLFMISAVSAFADLSPVYVRTSGGADYDWARGACGHAIDNLQDEAGAFCWKSFTQNYTRFEILSQDWRRDERGTYLCTVKAQFQCFCGGWGHVPCDEPR